MRNSTLYGLIIRDLLLSLYSIRSSLPLLPLYMFSYFRPVISIVSPPTNIYFYFVRLTYYLVFYLVDLAAILEFILEIRSGAY